MTLPIIVADRVGKDLSVYDSVAEAEADLEAIDVRNNEYVVFDADGAILGLCLSRERARGIARLFRASTEVPRIRDGGAARPDPARLRAALAAYLNLGGDQPALAAIPLGELIQKARLLRGSKGRLA